MTESIELADDLVRGVRGVAELLGQKPRTAAYFLENGMIPGAFKIGGVWHLRRSTARAWRGDVGRGLKG